MQSSVQLSENAAAKTLSAAAAAAAAQHSMILDAKQKVSQLGQKLHHTFSELEETRAAAQKAAHAAQEAHGNAAASAQLVAQNQIEENHHH